MLLLAGSAALWLLVGIPARYVLGEGALLDCGVVTLLCLIPAAVTLLLVELVEKTSPQQVALAALAASGMRMAVALGGGLLLTHSVPYFQNRTSFWGWLIVVYLLTLALDVSLMIAGRPQEKNVFRSNPPT
jgi:hypothetical protein